MDRRNALKTLAFGALAPGEGRGRTVLDPAAHDLGRDRAALRVVGGKGGRHRNAARQMRCQGARVENGVHHARDHAEFFLEMVHEGILHADLVGGLGAQLNQGEAVTMTDFNAIAN